MAFLIDQVKRDLEQRVGDIDVFKALITNGNDTNAAADAIRAVIYAKQETLSKNGKSTKKKVANNKEMGKITRKRSNICTTTKPSQEL